MNPGPRYYEYSAVLHVHSRYSDGFGTVPEILGQAREAEVDILGLTDHDTRRAAEDPGEGYHGRVLLLVGAEVTPRQNHVLTWFTETLPPANEPLHTIIQRVSDQGGLSFIAHPNDRGNRTLRLPSYRWTERDIRDFTGIEVWNHLSHWSDRVKGIPTGLWNLRLPWRVLYNGPRAEDLALWDRLAQERPTVGIGGVDAHAVPVPRTHWKVFSYGVSFHAIRTQIFLTEPLSHQNGPDLQQIKRALRDGHCAIMAAHLGREKGFRYWIEDPSQVQFMGDRVSFCPKMRLRGISPVKAIWHVVRNGGRVHTTSGHLLDIPVVEPGCYRVELFRGKKGRAWIYSNPIYVEA